MFTLLIVGGVLVVLLGVLVLLARFWLGGPDLAAFDAPLPKYDVPLGRESARHRTLTQSIAADLATRQNGKQSATEAIATLRKALDERGVATPIDAELLPVRAAGVAAEWVIAPGAVATRRLLYIHGGGYVAGSTRSHRPIAARLSAIGRAAVLVIDYRLMPEHPRGAGIDDCRAAYRWLLDHGPRGAERADTLIVAGDSAGGNLALSTIAWARDERLRPADAVVVFSPQTDATFSGPSVRKNLATDVLQGPAIAPVANAPRPLLLWMSFAMQRIAPNDPSVSPLFGDLGGLPPTLVQVSANEVFLSDAVRYANKARAQGLPVTLQLWPHTLHAWQVFDLPEAVAALQRVEAFLRRHAP